MKKLAVLFLVALLSLELAGARVFYYADEGDYRANMDYALARHFDGVDPAVVGDLDKYACVSLGDYNAFADESPYDGYAPLTAATASRDDLDRLRRADQLRLVDEDPYDSLTRDSVDDYDDWDCYTLRDYNSRAAENAYDDRDVIDFTNFRDLSEVQRIGKYRYNYFYAFPEDFARFNLQNTVARLPYYEPYDVRHSPYALYGYGVRRVEDY